jgi:hypothetical protein
VALEQDAAGNIEITKSKSKQKVDGAIALAMAIGVAQTEGACSILRGAAVVLDGVGARGVTRHLAGTDKRQPRAASDVAEATIGRQ